MATLKVLNRAGHYHDPNARADVLNYIFQPDKTESGLLGCIHVHPLFIIESMDQVSDSYKKATGIQIRHFILAFSPDEVNDPNIADEIAQHIMNYIGQRYQAVYAVHEDTSNLHIHFAFNAISYLDGQRYYGKKADYYSLVAFIKKVLHSYGIHRLYEISCRSDVDAQWE